MKDINMDKNDIIAREKELGLLMERLLEEDRDEAQGLAHRLAEEAEKEGELNRACSAAYARLLCRFLLSKRNKSRLTDIIREDELLRTAVFGRLNTYKYSLVFLLKRVLRLNDPDLTAQILGLIRDNPFEEKGAKAWSDRWSIDFVIAEALKAPEDYLAITPENKETAESFLTAENIQ